MECVTQLMNYESYYSLPDIIALAIMYFEFDSNKKLFVLPTIHHSNRPREAPVLAGEKDIRVENAYRRLGICWIRRSKICM